MLTVWRANFGRIVTAPLTLFVVLAALAATGAAGCATGELGPSEETGRRQAPETGPPVDAADTGTADTPPVDADTVGSDADTGGADDTSADGGGADDTSADGGDTGDTRHVDTEPGDVAPDVDPCASCGPKEVCQNDQCVNVCTQTGAQCGNASYGGKTVQCGGCSGAGMFCQNNTCKDVCKVSGAECGEVFWGGPTGACGGCSGARSCFNNRCVQPGWRHIDGGAVHTCGARSGGAVRCWGDNDYGQLGDTTSNDSNMSTAVSGISSGEGVATNGYHSCAIDSGTVKCWGVNRYFQLGTTNGGSHNSPNVVAGISGVSDVAGGLYHNCAVDGGGQVWCWGRGNVGQLGNGKKPTKQAQPVKAKTMDDAVEVVAGFNHTCALREDGTVWCWGDGSSGKLGNASFGSTTPVEVSNLKHVIDLAAGANHNCAVTRDGNAHCWGENGNGQIGNGTYMPALWPNRVKSLSDVRRVAAGQKHSCAVDAKGDAYCWGKNDQYGQLGNGTRQSVTTPVGVSNLQNVVGLGLGYSHSCAVTDDGNAHCWGKNNEGQLGDGSAGGDSTKPVQVR